VPELHPIAHVRAEQEAVKSQWSMAVREGILEALRRNGEFHADDLAPLGIPDQHRNIIGSQTAKLVNQQWIVEVGRRKSTQPGRNGAKSGVYKLTVLGRAKVSAGSPSCDGNGGGSNQPAPPASVGTGDHSSAATSTAAGESARLFELPSRSAITDAEAA
jgi:hypothetical protein